MYFNCGKGTAIIFNAILTLLAFSSKLAYGEEQPNNVQINMVAQPATCVALTQGRKCFAQISIQWRVAQASDYCIYQQHNNALVQCWQNSRGNTALFEFESSESITFELVNKQKKVIARTQVDVSWVHKASPRKRRWRLF